MKKMISGNNLVKYYGEGDERVRVLDGVSIEVFEGEFICVMGPSGSGKSTLMFALSGMDGVDSGTVSFDGKELSNLKENELSDIRRKRMGFVFQQPTLLKNLNIMDNIILPSMRGRSMSTAKIAEAARSLMKMTGIEDLETRDITQVSGGQLQRAGICRALMGAPDIIFGDEPTGALNSKASQEIMNLFTEINEKGTTVMLVTHDAMVAARAQRILFIRDGKVINEACLAKYDAKCLNERIGRITEITCELGI